MSQKTTITCDICGIDKERGQEVSVGAQPHKLWSVFEVITDYRPCGAGGGLETKTYDVCTACTDKVLALMKKRKKL